MALADNGLSYVVESIGISNGVILEEIPRNCFDSQQGWGVHCFGVEAKCVW